MSSSTAGSWKRASTPPRRSPSPTRSTSARSRTRNTDVTASATGELTLHGVTKTVTFDVQGRSTGSQVQIAGSIPITFADWGISNPSFGPVTTQDNGNLEFSIVFVPA